MSELSIPSILQEMVDACCARIKRGDLPTLTIILRRWHRSEDGYETIRLPLAGTLQTMNDPAFPSITAVILTHPLLWQLILKTR